MRFSSSLSRFRSFFLSHRSLIACVRSLSLFRSRWCEDHWKAQILLDSRLVEWNRSWKDKQIAADGLSTGRRAKRRRLAKEAKMAKVGDGDGMDDDKQGHSEDDGAGDESQMVMMDDGQEMHEEAEIDESEV